MNLGVWQLAMYCDCMYVGTIQVGQVVTKLGAQLFTTSMKADFKIYIC